MTGKTMRRSVLGCLLTCGLAGALYASDPVEPFYAATDAEVYMLERLAADVETIRAMRARADELAKAHDTTLTVFLADVTARHRIELKRDEAIGWSGPRRAFYVKPAPAPITSTGTAPEAVGTK